MDIRCDRCKKNVETKEDALSVFDTDKCVACIRQEKSFVTFSPIQIATVEEVFGNLSRSTHTLIAWMATNSGCDKCSRCGTWDYVSELAHTLCDDCRDDQIGI